MISAAAREAYEWVRSGGGVPVRSDLCEGADGDAFFDIAFVVAQPNLSGLGPDVAVRIVLPRAFPWKEAEVLLLDEGEWRFAHMGIDDGKLCLPAAEVWQSHPADSITRIIRDAETWLKDAAQGSLLKPGDHWELPDFRGKEKRPASALAVWVNESKAELEIWAPRVGQCGDVLLARHATGKALVPIEFKGPDGENIPGAAIEAEFFRTQVVPRRKEVPRAKVWPGSVRDQAPKIGPLVRGKWLLMPGLVYTTHRPPKTFRELSEMCDSAGIRLWNLLGAGERWDAFEGVHYLLVGAPIPEVVDGEPVEVHWQLVVVPARLVGHSKKERSGRGRPLWLATSLPGQVIPWGVVHNVAPERIGARGHFGDEACAAGVAVIGAGAIGSMVVDHLVRGGERDLAIFDFEVVEPGNLCRHTLGPIDVGLGKAERLTKKYQGIRPDLRMHSHDDLLPLALPYDMSKSWVDLLRAAVWIDCSGNEAVWRWLSRLGKERGKKVVQVFTNPYAWNLCILLSGRKVGLAKVKRLFEVDRETGVASVREEEIYPANSEIPVGAGCWHPAFPALGCDMQGLVGAAMPLIVGYVEKPWRAPGRAIVLRRKPVDVFQEVASPESLIEIAWNKAYR